MITRENIEIRGEFYTVRLYGYDDIEQYRPESLPLPENHGLTNYDLESYEEYKREFRRQIYDRDCQAYKKKIESYSQKISIIKFLINFIIPFVCLWIIVYLFEGKGKDIDPFNFFFIGLFTGLITIGVPSCIFYVLYKAGNIIKKILLKRYKQNNPPPYPEPIKPTNYNKIYEYKEIHKQILERNAQKNQQLKRASWNKYKAISYLDFFKVYISVVEVFVDIIAEVLTRQKNKANPKWWSNLGDYEFEKEIAQWFRDMGYNANVTQKSGDGGIDIILTKPNYKAFVQCKRFTNNKVSASVVRELYGVVCSDNANQAIIVSLLGATKDAEAFMKKNSIIHYTVKDFQEYYARRNRSCINATIKKRNMNWIQIGDYFLLTSVFCTKDDAERYKTQLVPQDGYCYKIIHSSNCFILYGKIKEIEYLIELFKMI